MENKETEIDLIHLLKVMWAERLRFVKWGCVGFVVGVIIAFSIPKSYQTEVKIAPEGGASNSNMGSMGGLAAMMGVNVGAMGTPGITEKVYPEIVKSTPFLLEFKDIVVMHDGREITLYDYIINEQKRPWWSYVIGAPMQALGWVVGLVRGGDNAEHETEPTIFRPDFDQKEFIGTMNKKLKVEPDKESGVFMVKACMQDPVIAAIVADSMISKLQRYMIEYRTSKTRGDLVANEKMMEEARQEYYEADREYAMAQDQNQNLISKEAQMKISRLSNEKELAFSVYQQLATQVEMSRIKLQENTPIATIIEPASVSLIAQSPNKKLIVAGCVFLAILVVGGVILVKDLNKAEL